MKSLHFCQKHEVSHSLFNEEHSACEICAAEIFKSQKFRAEEIYETLKKELSPEQFDRLHEWAVPIGFKTNEDNELWALRAAIAQALVGRQDINRVVETVIEQESVDSIMPPGL